MRRAAPGDAVITNFAAVDVDYDSKYDFIKTQATFHLPTGGSGGRSNQIRAEKSKHRCKGKKTNNGTEATVFDFLKRKSEANSSSTMSPESTVEGLLLAQLSLKYGQPRHAFSRCGVVCRTNGQNNR